MPPGAWKTRFTSVLAPCRLPLMGAPMAGVSGGRLAAETGRAGALGFVAAGHVTNESQLQQLEEQIRIFREHNGHNSLLGIGWIGYSSFGCDAGWEYFRHVLKVHKPDVVQCFAPALSQNHDSQQTNVQIAHEHNAKVLLQVGSVAEAQAALDAGADGLIAQGSEAGGHGRRRELGNGTLALAARVVKLAQAHEDRPLVLAAGGIADGRGLAAALALGCDGAVVGTRLWASSDTLLADATDATNATSNALQQSLVEAKSGDAVHRTRVFDEIQNVGNPLPWPSPYDSVGALRNRTSEQWDGQIPALQNELQDETSSGSLLNEYREAQANKDPNIACVLAGEGVGEIDAIEPAYDIILQMERDARRVIQSLPQIL